MCACVCVCVCVCACVCKGETYIEKVPQKLLCLANGGEGNGNPLQCSCLENPRNGGAWWAAVYGVAQSQTRLKQLSSSSRRGRENSGQRASHSTLMTKM